MNTNFTLQLYDRLSKVGVCLSHQNTTILLDKITGNFNCKLVNAIKSGKHLRIVGDNIDFYLGVRDERKGFHGSMKHFFGSAFIVKELSFPDFITSGPQLSTDKITVAHLLPNPTEIPLLVQDYAYLCMQVAATKMPFFSFLKKDLPMHLTDDHSKQLLEKTLVIPIGALPRNEHSHGDVVEILR